MIEKPDGVWQCRACREIWRGEVLYLDPSAFGIRWTCRDLTCGGTVDDITATKRGHEFMEEKADE